MRPSRFFELLRALTQHNVDFIVVGGVAAIVEGAPVTTIDLDIFFARTPENINLLLRALGSLNARYRVPAGRHIVPNRDRLAKNTTNLLHTDLGPIDVLAEIGNGEGYSLLLFHSNARKVGDIVVNVLNLEKIIETKEAAGRDKDRYVLPVLKRALELKRQR